MDSLKEFLPLALAGLALATAIWNILQSPSKKNADEMSAFKAAVANDIRELDTDAEGLKERISTVETLIKQLPTRDNFHEIDKGLTEVRGKIETMSVSVTEASRTAHRIEDFLTAQARSAS